MIGTVASAGQPLEKHKVILDQAASESAISLRWSACLVLLRTIVLLVV
jgi:hypothetical protein